MRTHRTFAFGAVLSTTAKLAFASSALALLLACGGGGSASSTASSSPSVPTALSVTVQGSGLSWAAFQDGSGLWSSLDLSSGRASLPVHDAAGRYGLALGYVDSHNSHKITRVWQGTLAEKSEITFAIPGGQSVDLTGTVSGLSASEVAFGFFRGNSWTSGTNTGFNTNCEPGTGDFAVTAWDTSTGQTSKVLLQRNQTFGASASLPAMDMASAQTLSPVSVSIPGLSGTAYLNSECITHNGTSFGLSSPSSTSAPYPVNILPGAALASGDIQNVEGEESLAGGFRFASTFITSVSSVALNLPAAFSANVTPVPSGFIAQGNRVASAKVYAGSAQQSSSKTYEYLWISAGWFGNGTSLAYATPDLQSISGWSYTSGQTLSWYFGALGGSYGLQPSVPQPYKKGDSDWGTYASGSFIPTLRGGMETFPVELPSEDREALRTLLRH